MALTGNSGITYSVLKFALENPTNGQVLTFEDGTFVNASVQGGGGSVSYATTAQAIAGAAAGVAMAPVTTKNFLEAYAGAAGLNILKASTTAAAQNLLEAGAAGLPVFKSATTAAALDLLGAGTYGKNFFAIATTAAAQNYLEAGAAGLGIFKSATTAAAQNLLEAGAVGLQVWKTTTTAKAQDALGGTTVGKSLFQAATTAAALDLLGGGVVGEQIFAAATTAAAQAIIGAGGTPGGSSGNIQYNNAGAFGGAGTIDASANLSGMGTYAGGLMTLTSSSASAFTVGANGSTNPALKVDASTASSAGGLQIKSDTAANGVALSTISSGADADMGLSSKGAGTLTLQAGSTGTISFAPGGGQRATLSSSVYSASNLINYAFATTTSNAAATVRFLYTGAANTALSNTTEFTQIHFNMGQTNQHASNGTVTLQRDMRISGMTHTAASATKTFTNTAALAIDGYAQAGTNSQITTGSGLYIPTQAVAGTVTNAYGINVAAPTGAGTLNYAINATGNSSIGTIVAGTWNGTVIDIAHGGTGAATTAAALNSLGAGAFGAAMFAVSTTAAAQNLLEAGAVGLTVFKAATTVAAQNRLGGTATGISLFEAADTTAARSAIFAVASVTAGVSGANVILNMVSLTSGAYESITPNAKTLYFIT